MQNKTPSMGGVWMFSGITQYNPVVENSHSYAFIQKSALLISKPDCSNLLANSTD